LPHPVGLFFNLYLVTAHFCFSVNIDQSFITPKTKYAKKLETKFPQQKISRMTFFYMQLIIKHVYSIGLGYLLPAAAKRLSTKRDKK